MKRASGKSHSQVALQAVRATFLMHVFPYLTLERANGKLHWQLVLQACRATFWARAFLY